MAGEKRGLACEAIISLALTRAKVAVDGETLHWNVTPSGCSIDVDLTIGRDRQSPDVVLQIAYPESYLDSNRKFWRNLAELWEAKVRLSKPARVVNVQFGDGMKEDLVTLSHQAFDSFIHVCAASGFHSLPAWVAAHSKTLPTDKTAKLGTISDALDGAASDVKAEFRTLQRLVCEAVSNGSSRFDAIWNTERKRLRAAVAPAAPPLGDLDTHLRRGLAKVLLSEDPKRLVEAVRSGKKVADNEALHMLGIVANSIAGPRLTDPEALWVCRRIPHVLLVSLIDEVLEDGRFATIRAPLLHLDAVRATANYLIRNWQTLSDPAFAFDALRLPWHMPKKFLQQMSDESGTNLPTTSYVRPGCVWEMAMECLRFCDDRSQAFGQSGILKRLDSQSGRDRKAIEALAKQLGIAPISWRAASTVSYGLRDWVYGADRSNFSLSDFELLRCAFVLSMEIAARAFPAAGTAEQIVAQWANNLFETKLASYREFRPLDMIVERTLSAAQVDFERINYHTTFWREVGIHSGATLNARSGATTLYRAGATLINTQSMTDEGSSHKKKELMARGCALRYTLRSGKVKSASVRLVLVLDGELGAREMRILQDAGWEHILTPESIELLGEIVRSPLA